MMGFMNKNIFLGLLLFVLAISVAEAQYCTCLCSDDAEWDGKTCLFKNGEAHCPGECRVTDQPVMQKDNPTKKLVNTLAGIGVHPRVKEKCQPAGILPDLLGAAEHLVFKLCEKEVLDEIEAERNSQ